MRKIVLVLAMSGAMIGCTQERMVPPPSIEVYRSDEPPPPPQPPPPPPDIRDDPACKLFRWPLSPTQAAAVLTNTETFADTGIYVGGEPPPQLAAFNVLLDQPDAAVWFEQLASDGTPAGRLYALCGLQVLDGQHALLAFELRAMSAKVFTQFGCTGMHESVSELVDVIEKYHYGKSFRASRERTFKYYERDINLCTRPRRVSVLPDGGQVAEPANQRSQAPAGTHGLS